MKRLLCIVNTLNAGGAETFLMKLYRNIDRNMYQMDFCVMSEDRGIYEDEILERGGKVFHARRKSKNPIKCFMDIKRIVKENKYYFVLRVNENSLSVIDLIAARMGGAKVLAMRSSNAGNMNSLNAFLHKIFKFLPKLVPDIKIAPSTEAAEYTFGKKCVSKGKAYLLHNGLDFDLYKFNMQARNKIRTELNIDDCLVIGHVGRMSAQKNHMFLIEVFAKIAKIRSDARLILVGTGELEEQIRNQIKISGIEEKVIFLGRRNDVPEILSAFDVFVFPSFHEGMPNVIIEAQASGLPCVISDTITPEADITGLVKYMSLESSAEKWAKVVLNESEHDMRINTYSAFQKAEYDIQSVSDKFIQLIFEGASK